MPNAISITEQSARVQQEPGIKAIAFSASITATNVLSITTNNDYDGILISARAVPGTDADAPEAAFGFELRDGAGYDVLEGAGAACSTAAATEAVTAYGLKACTGGQFTIVIDPKTGTTGTVTGEIQVERK